MEIGSFENINQWTIKVFLSIEMFIMNFSVFLFQLDFLHHQLTFVIIIDQQHNWKNPNDRYTDEIKLLVMELLIHFLFHQHSVFHNMVQKKSINQATIDFLISLDVPKFLPPSTKRYVSSFKTLVHATNHKQTQRLNYINDSVMIFKLSKERKQQKSNIFNFLFKLNRCKWNQYSSTKSSFIK